MQKACKSRNSPSGIPITKDMVEAVNGQSSVRAQQAQSLGDVLRASLASGMLKISVPMRAMELRLPVPGGKVLDVDVARGTVMRLEGHIVESPEGPRLSGAKLTFQPELVITNPSAIVPAEHMPKVGGGFFSRAADALLKVPVRGAAIDANGALKLDVYVRVPLGGDKFVGDRVPDGTFKKVPMLVADWFKSNVTSSVKAAAQSSSGEPDALDAAEAFSKAIESAILEASISGTESNGKRTQLQLNGSMQRVQDRFEGSLKLRGDLDSNIPVPSQGPTSILGTGVQAAVQGTVSATVDASLAFGGGTVSGAARNIVVDMNILNGSLMGDTVSLALGQKTNVAIRAAAVALDSSGKVSLEDASVVANVDIGAGRIALEDSSFEVQSGHLEIGPSADAAKLADVRYSLVASANAEGKANADKAVTELKDLLAQRAEAHVNVSGEVKVDANLS